MKTTRIFILRSSLFVFATMLLPFSAGQASAQSANPQTASTPLKSVARITQAIDEKKLVPMQTKVHSLARPEFDRGVVADSQPMNRMILVLKRSDQQEAALRELMDEQQTKNSPNYRAWLTPTQFGQQFGVADADVQTVTSWLTQKGFTGIKVSPGNMFVEFSGTAGLVRNAFHTEIHNFNVKGEAHMANVSVPQMPAALAPAVSGVLSLHNFRKRSFLHYADAAMRAKAQGKLRPGFTATPCGSLGTGTCFAMGPADFAKIYNIPSTLDGTNQTIALVARSNINLQDITDYRTGFGLPANFTSANIILTGSDPGITPDAGEATLDVEVAGGVAPKAQILLVVSDGTVTTNFSDGVDLSIIYIVTNNLAPIMSTSFGAAEIDSLMAFNNSVWEQAASQGITAMVSTGDQGAATEDGDAGDLEAQFGLTVNGLASTLFNVAVGGTDFDDASNPTQFWNTSNSGTGLLSAKSYINETTWNDSCAAAATPGSLGTCATETPDSTGLDLTAGGGGQSGPCGQQDNLGNCLGPNPKPVWQAGVGVPADSARDIPDVSLFASNGAHGNFWILCFSASSLQNNQGCNLTGPNFNFTGVGGTSASSPAFAGIMALINQSEVTAGRSGRQGNANYVLYPSAQTAGASCDSSLPGTITSTTCIFYDTTKGNISVECAGTSPNCSSATAGTNGVLVEPTTPAPFSATNPAWTTTAGFDLATGLGSVNVTNLASKWGTIVTGFKGDTTTITAPAAGTVTITHGDSVSFTVKVAQNSGTTVPSGDVSIIAQLSGSSQFSIVPGGTLSGGTTTIPTLQLPGGTYPVVAHYAGDGTFAASDSAPFNVTVAKENSATTTTMYEWWTTQPAILSPASAPYGSLYLFRMDVIGSHNQDNQQCVTATANIACPTGTITLTADGSALNDFLNTATGTSTNVATLNAAGLVEDRLLGTTGLKGGAHSIGAAYSGDNSYNASAATALGITITPASTQTAVTATVGGNPVTTVTPGQSVTLTATINTVTPLPVGGISIASNGAGPTGSVTFSSCGTASSCTVNVVPVSFANSGAAAEAFATATLTTSFSTAGAQTITATFTAGDTNYNNCTLPTNTAADLCTLTPATFTVTPPGTIAVTSTALTLSSASGASAGSTITVTPSNGFTGQVTVTATASSLPPGVTCPNSPLNISVTGPNAATGTLNCQVAATSTTLTASNFRDNRMLEGKTIPSAPVGPNSGKGWWALSAGTGFAALFLLFLPGGRKRLRAALGLGLVCLLSFTLGCGGNGNNPPPKTATTTKLTVTNGSNGRVASGTAFTFSAAVSGGTPTGNVQLFDGSTAIGSPAAVSGGTATLTAPATLAVGTHTISAQYLGDTTTLASSSGMLNLTVTGGTTVTITTTPAATPAASPITVTVQ